MEGRYLSEIRQSYRDLKLDQGDSERAIEITKQPLYSPLLKVREVHPEAEPDQSNINEMITEMFFDMSSIDNELVQSAEDLKALMLNTIQRLEAVEDVLNKEKERQQDINILCNKYTDFATVIDLNESFFTGDFTVDDGVFSSKIEDEVKVTFDIVSINGNGYEGNAYVYKDGGFLKDVIDTSKRSYIQDTSPITAYEYSRITANNTEQDVFPLVNFDSIEAKCSVTIHSNTAFNTLELKSDRADLVLLEVYVSEDGASFKEVSKKAISLSNIEKRYEVQDYVPGSGLISFPTTNYVKIVLQSNGFLDDEIAFYKTDTVKVEEVYRFDI